MGNPTISIIGAGIGGLTLGRCLLHRGIITTIYEKSRLVPRHNYGITLHAPSYLPLLEVLGLDELTFREKVAVDANIGGLGKLSPNSSLASSSFRANRARLEELLCEGLDVRWDHELQSITAHPRASRSLQFENGKSVTSDVIVSAEGPHSSVRKQFLPLRQAEILPFVVFNGKRKIARTVFDQNFAPAMHNSTVLQEKQGQTVLNVSLNDIDDKSASISWTYSRPAHGSLDPLHMPHRSNSEANNVPASFFQEINELLTLPVPFVEIFQTKLLKQDRVLHWLMRRLLVPVDELHESGQQGICFIGDAIHTEQIIGGNGANTAILDALSLAEHLHQSGATSLSSWYSEQFKTWQQAQGRALGAISKIHARETHI